MARFERDAPPPFSYSFQSLGKFQNKAGKKGNTLELNLHFLLYGNNRSEFLGEGLLKMQPVCYLKSDFIYYLQYLLLSRFTQGLLYACKSAD